MAIEIEREGSENARNTNTEGLWMTFADFLMSSTRYQVKPLPTRVKLLIISIVIVECDKFSQRPWDAMAREFMIGDDAEAISATVTEQRCPIAGLQ